ncbi:glycosyltransferase family 4 protein [Priestia sp. FSL R5-0597]|uniref:glycosyltransferase family 4 protein n=1 Tax=Priestia TaxID=2800373 RepID=UPI0012B9383A|nr:glycosyltransferase family 4 protein [Priestia megaterium]
MKIVLIMGAFSFGGAERVMCNLANHLSENNHNVTLITLYNKEQCYPLHDNVHIVNGLNFRSKVKAISLLRKQIETLSPDVVMSFMTHINILTIISTLFKQIPIIISERNDPRIHPSGTYLRILRKILYPFADGVVFQTKEAQEFFSKSIISKSMIIPNPLTLDMKEKTEDGKRENSIVTVGRLTRQKNQALLIRSFKEVLKDFPNYKLRIYGEGNLREELLILIKQLNLEGKVILMGASDNILEEIDKCKIFVLPSDSEGMPNSLMEAMATGLPCICTDCTSGGPRYLIKDGQNGVLVPVGNQADLTKALLDLLKDEKKREIMGSNARGIFEKLDPHKVFSKWEGFLKNSSK